MNKWTYPSLFSVFVLSSSFQSCPLYRCYVFYFFEHFFLFFVAITWTFHISIFVLFFSWPVFASLWSISVSVFIAKFYVWNFLRMMKCRPPAPNLENRVIFGWLSGHRNFQSQPVSGLGPSAPPHLLVCPETLGKCSHRVL